MSFRSFSLFLLSFLAYLPVSSAIYTVTNTLDAGTGSLKDAINMANTHIGMDSIHFDIGTTGVKTISLLTSLPNITDSLFIDGGSDPGYTGIPLIEIDINKIPIGIHVLSTAPYSHIHGLILNNSDYMALRIAAEHVKVTGCYVGTDPTGSIAVANDFVGIGIYSGHHAQVGGVGVNEGNLISGNGGIGLFMSTVDTAAILGNIIGTDLSGSYAIANSVGINPSNSSDIMIGGNTALHRNLISGNSNGIIFTGGLKYKVYGNYIGTDATGLLAIPNRFLGIRLTGDSCNIGGILPGQGNLISGNGNAGIRITGQTTPALNPRANNIQGNLIGTDITGTLAIPNGYGLNLIAGVYETLIGGNTAAHRNIISGNRKAGIRFNVADSNYVFGNYIGTDISGTQALGNQESGIEINLATKTFIGNATAATANLIVSNEEHGINIHNDSDSTYVRYNYIGTDVTGLLNLANMEKGIWIGDGATYSFIGGTLADEGNIIANNLQGGIEVNAALTLHNSILGNSIYDHTVSGISLIGGNNMQAAPDITGFVGGPSTTISGTFNSAPNANYRIEFFTSNTNEQGKTLIGISNITTDATGGFFLNETFPVVITPAEPILTATATDSDGNTSAFGVEVVLNTEISVFTAIETKHQTAYLQWEIEESEEALHFKVEHKIEGDEFQKIGEQELFRTESLKRHYVFETHRLSPGVHYFRLKRINPSGQQSFSRTIALKVSPKGLYTFHLENPVTTNSHLRLKLEQSQYVKIEVLDIQGKKLATIFSSKVDAGTDLELPMDKLHQFTEGMYILSIQGSYVRMSKRFMLK